MLSHLAFGATSHGPYLGRFCPVLNMAHYHLKRTSVLASGLMGPLPRYIKLKVRFF